jgi:thiosulfate dehydrogenase
MLLGVLLAAVLLMGFLWLPTVVGRALQEGDVGQGAWLYDDWTAMPGVTLPPAEDMPLWKSEPVGVQGGKDTWRCVTCHGWDYGSGGDGPANLLAVRAQPAEELLAALDGTRIAGHDFSPYLSAQQLDDLVAFLQQGTFDDSQVIDRVSRRVIGGDTAHGQQLYQQSCATCHAADGSGQVFREQGQEMTLAKLAVQDPWRFMHRTRFGVARAPQMPVGNSLGWSVQDGRDVLLYVQSFANVPPSEPGLQDHSVVEQKPGGPAGGLWSGVLTAMGAMVTSLGFAILLGAFLVGVIFLVVWAIRGKK